MRAVAFATLAAASFAASAAFADVPDPRLPMLRSAETGWVRDVQRRLESGIDHTRGVGRVAVAEVRFNVDPQGRIADAALIGPSGSEVLDELALEAVRRARHLPRPPEAYVGKPVRFRLEVTKPASLPLTW